MINICKGKIEGLIISEAKIQITYIYRDERPNKVINKAGSRYHVTISHHT